MNRAASYSRIFSAMRKMSPGTMGGQSRVATPASYGATATALQTGGAAAIEPFRATWANNLNYNITSLTVSSPTAGLAGDREVAFVLSTATISDSGGWTVTRAVLNDGNWFSVLQRAHPSSATSLVVGFASVCNASIIRVIIPPGSLTTFVDVNLTGNSVYSLNEPTPSSSTMVGCAWSQGSNGFDVTPPAGSYPEQNRTLESSSSITARIVAWAYAAGDTTPTFELGAVAVTLRDAVILGRPD